MTILCKPGRKGGQAERYDKHGDFVRHWIPELKKVPDSHVHQPHYQRQIRVFLNRSNGGIYEKDLGLENTFG